MLAPLHGGAIGDSQVVIVEMPKCAGTAVCVKSVCGCRTDGELEARGQRTIQSDADGAGVNNWIRSANVDSPRKRRVEKIDRPGTK